MIFMIWTKCQNMLRWSGQNANQKVGMDKMPTTEISPDKMPTFGWHYVQLAFCPVGILSAHLFTQTPNDGLCEECSKVGLQVVFGWQAGNQDSVPSPRQPAVASASQPESHAPCRAMGELTQAVRGWRHHCTKSQQVSYTMRP